ncbi:acid phosphatase [Saitozyma sp. JCM 24511]|nr:acid phosphatase [Saitozyma sp. JCM 24511]
MLSLVLASLLPALAHAQTVQTFAPPAACPVCVSGNYTGMSNGSLPVAPVVAGKSYDRFITIWLENTDFASAAASTVFQSLAKQGILLTNYNGVTHPSEPNYVAAMAGDFFGMGDDNNYYLPSNVSSMVDLLEAKNVSWASYQENMPYDGFAGDYAQPNYLNASAGSYTYYKRKHNPHIIFNSVASNPNRALRVRNFNDFAVDVNASALPQHVWITPNLVNDAHDTDVTFVSAWLSYWLVPLLNNTQFNNNRTLIQLTFDENESYTIQNTVYTVLLGGAVPENLRGTNDSTFYTHYSMMSSTQNNWGLGSLGRQDTNKTVAAVWNFQANQTGYTNYVPSAAEIPMLNLTTIFPGAANTGIWTPILAPNVSAVGAGGGSVFYNSSSTNTSLTSYTAQNLTAMNLVNPDTINPNYTYTGFNVDNTSSPAAISASSAQHASAAATSGASAATTSKASAGEKTVATGGVLGAVALGLAMLL